MPPAFNRERIFGRDALLAVCTAYAVGWRLHSVVPLSHCAVVSLTSPRLHLTAAL